LGARLSKARWWEEEKEKVNLDPPPTLSQLLGPDDVISGYTLSDGREKTVLYNKKTKELTVLKDTL
jgi:hypothetical protein